jgi:hypothetical protein
MGREELKIADCRMKIGGLLIDGLLIYEWRLVRRSQVPNGHSPIVSP